MADESAKRRHTITWDDPKEAIRKIRRVIMTLAPQEVHYNPMGCVHGGILATLLDSVMSAAVHTALPAGTLHLTREFTIKFIRPVFDRTGEIMADGRIVSVEGRTAVAEGRIIAADDRIYAIGRATGAVFDPSQLRAIHESGAAGEQ